MFGFQVSPPPCTNAFSFGASRPSSPLQKAPSTGTTLGGNAFESPRSTSSSTPNPLASPRSSSTAGVSGSFGAGSTGSLTRPNTPVNQPVQDHSNTVLSDVRVAKIKCLELDNDINDIIEVTVGSGTSRAIFVVHRSIAIKRIGVLVLEKGPFRGKGPRYELSTVEPEVFGAYLHHVYTQQIPSKPHRSDPTAYNHHTEEFTLLCKFAALATRMHDATAESDAIRAIHAKAHEQCLSHPMLPNSKDIDIIYNATYRPCSAGKLMVDLYVWTGAATSVKESTVQGPSYPAEFPADLTVALLEQRDRHSKATKIQPVCEYWEIVCEYAQN